MNFFVLLCNVVIAAGIVLPVLISSRKSQGDDEYVVFPSKTLTFNEEMTKTILRAAVTLKKGGSIPQGQYVILTETCVKWLFGTFLHIVMRMDLDQDHHLDLEKARQLFLSELGPNVPNSKVWGEMVKPTILLLFDENKDGFISDRERISATGTRYLHEVMLSIDEDQNGLTLDELQLALFLPTTNTNLQEIKSMYSGMRVPREDIMKAFSELVDSFEKHNTRDKTTASQQRSSFLRLWESTKFRAFVTAILAATVMILIWDCTKRSRDSGRGTRGQTIDQEILRQRREIYQANRVRKTAGSPGTSNTDHTTGSPGTSATEQTTGSAVTENIKHTSGSPGTLYNDHNRESPGTSNTKQTLGSPGTSNTKQTLGSPGTSNTKQTSGSLGTSNTKQTLESSGSSSIKRNVGGPGTSNTKQTSGTQNSKQGEEGAGPQARPDKPVLKREEPEFSSQQSLQNSQRLTDAGKKTGRAPSIEESLVELLSEVLQVQVRLRGSGSDGINSQKVLVVQSSDLSGIIVKAASTNDIMQIKHAAERSPLAGLFEKRAAREYGKMAAFACHCWSRCANRLQGESEPIIKAMLEFIKDATTGLVITCLNQAYEEESQEEGLWAAFKPDPTRSTEGKQLLECMANWDEDGMKPELLQQVLSQLDKLPLGYLKVVKVIQSAGLVLRADKRFDEHFFHHAKMLAGLENLFKSPAVKAMVVKRLEEEIDAAAGDLGSYFERESVLGPLLALTTVPACVKEGIDPNNPFSGMWSTLSGFPNLLEDDVQLLSRNIAKGRQLVNQSVTCALKEVFRTNCHVGIRWLSRMLAQNEMRTTVTLTMNPGDAQTDLALSDGFMLNVCYVLLDLCMPFCGNRDKFTKIDPTYTTSPCCHLGYSQETSLAGGMILGQTEEDNTESTTPELGRSSFNFMTQVFHVTLRAMNVGLMPALQQFKKHIKVMNDSMANAEEMGMGEQAKGQRLLVALLWEAHLMDYDLLEKGTRFYLTVCQWIQHLLDKAKEDKGGEKMRRRQEAMVLKQVPEFVIKDMAHWFTFVSTHGTALHRNILNSVQLGDFLECCVLLISRRDLLPGPIPSAALCQTLLNFTSSPKSRNKGWSDGGMSELALAVHSCAAVQNDLCPGLVLTYVSVDVVEGLDVDKDEFDKFVSRYEIGALLTKLWSRADCKQSVLQMCGTQQFQSFLGAIFDTLLYQLHDSLARLANVRKLELAKPTWDSLPSKEQREKSQFLKSEEQVAKGFMSMATQTVSLLEMITTSDEVARCLTVMPLAKRAASAFLGFLESLCGSRSTDFKVKDMKKYNWEPRMLLIQLTGTVLQVVRQEQGGADGSHFTTSLATDADFNPHTLIRANQVLEEKTIAKEDFVAQFRALTEMLCDANAAYSKKDDPGGQLLLQEQLNKVINHEQLNKVYKAELLPLCYDTARILETHAFQANAVTMPVDARSKRCRALMKETRAWMNDLPVDAQAAIFLRQGEERMDVVRALVTGPPDTPYSLGCFVFDIYFPPTYPDIPPLVKFTTTGGGTVRFNPNLYADGKVCLSLLGTWHGGDASQKWQPGKSSLYQVLLSIQSMILISSPMYNEPGYDGIQGTAEGNAQSHRYNAKLRLSTLRHAIHSQITRPPKGFEKVVRRHFFYQKDALKKQCHNWLLEADDAELKQKMERIVEDLVMELDNLKLQDDKEEDTDSDDE